MRCDKEMNKLIIVFIIHSATLRERYGERQWIEREDRERKR